MKVISRDRIISQHIMLTIMKNILFITRSPILGYQNVFEIRSAII